MTFPRRRRCCTTGHGTARRLHCRTRGLLRHRLDRAHPHQAAAHGPPAVASELLCRHVGWTDRSDILCGGDNDADGFADAVVALHDDPDLWNTVRAGALLRIETEASPDGYLRRLGDVLEEVTAEKNNFRNMGPGGRVSRRRLPAARVDGLRAVCPPGWRSGRGPVRRPCAGRAWRHGRCDRAFRSGRLRRSAPGR